jgi:hypothetical protein
MSQQLCLEISPTNFSGAVIDRKTRVELQQFDTKLEGRTTEDKKDQIKELLHRQGLLSFSDEVSLAIQSAKSTLVPQNIFGESKAEDIYRLCFGAALDSVDYNRFHEQGLVNVYAQEDWVKSFFVIRFPKIIIQHENTHVLRGIFNGSTFKTQLHLVPSAEHFSLLVSAKNKLEFYNIFDSRTLEDMLYHTSFVLQQKEIKPSEIQLHWHGDSNQTQGEEFASMFGKIVQENALPISFHVKRTHQLHCV